MSGTDELKKRMEALMNKEIKVGWFEGNNYPDSGLPVAFVASILEYGANKSKADKDGNKVVHIPARFPMRKTMEEKGKQISAELAGAVNKAMQTGEIDEWMNKFGFAAAEHFKSTIDSGLQPGNSEATILGMLNPKTGKRRGSAAKNNRKFGQGKGFDKPGIDTGRLVNTLVHKVEG